MKEHGYQTRVLVRDDLDLKKIAESGQTFRWKQIKPDFYRIIAFSKVLYVSQKELSAEEAEKLLTEDPDILQIPDTDNSPKAELTDSKEPVHLLNLSCSREEFHQIWKSYFDLDTSYRQIRNRIPKKDAFLYGAAAYGKGIRILRQDPWETLITFIISQRKNIPAIRSCVEKLSAVVGSRIEECQEELYAFPTPEQLLQIDCQKSAGLPEDGNCFFQRRGFKNCSLGYRMPYVLGAAAEYRTWDLPKIQALSPEQLREQLMKIKGVGVKVASCCMLFGFHRMDEFPVDVWIRRILDRYYANGYDFSAYHPYNGLMQQYMFFYATSGK